MTTVMATQHTGILAFRQTELRLHTSSLQERLTGYRVGCYPMACVNKALSWLLAAYRRSSANRISNYPLQRGLPRRQNGSGGKIRRCLPVLIFALAQLLTLTVSKSVGNGANLVTGTHVHCKLKLLFEILKSFYSTTLMYCAIGRIGPAAKCIQGKISAINKKSLLWSPVSISPDEHETGGNGETFQQVTCS